MPLKIILPKGIYDKENIILTDDGSVSNCTHPAGHCFGSDGGSGIPDNLKVAPGKGGNVEVWTLDQNKTTVTLKESYAKCQYCGKLSYEKTL